MSTVSPRRARVRGFALLVTIVLVAFLVLILVALATFARVETQVASNQQDLAAARQNALFALNLAVGELQRTAGPDQRVTGTADLAGTAGGARLSNGAAPANTSSVNGITNGLSAVQNGTRYWTGVWGNSDNGSPGTGNNSIYERTPSPVLLNWLVSGNHGASFTSSVASADFGRVSASNGGGGTTAPAFTPASAVSGLSTSMSAIEPVTVGGAEAILLVGPATVGTANHPTTGETSLDRFVAAPLVKIDAVSVPGLAGAQTIGRYAYWVGDEGVKARVNITDRDAGKTNAASDLEARYRLMSVPRTGLEVLADFTSTSYQAWSQSTAASPVLDRVLTPAQLRFLDPVNLTSARMGAHAHDLTAHSAGLHADSYNGGLRHDLTYELERSTLGTWTATNRQSAGAGTGILPDPHSPLVQSLTSADKRAPRWDILHSFYNLPSVTGNDLRGDSGDELMIRPATADQMGILPVIVKMRLLFGVAANATATTSTAVTPNLPANTYRMMASPLVVLANPYTVELKATAGIAMRFYNDTRLQDHNRLRLGNSTNRNKIFSSGGVLDGIRFQLPAFTLAPGEAAVFHVTGASNASSGGSVSMVRMAGSPPNASGFTDFVYRDFGGFNTSGGSVQFRFWETYNNSTVLAEFSLGTPGTSQTLQLLGGVNPNRSSNSYPSRNLVTNDASRVAHEALCFYEWRYTTPADDSPYAATAVPGVVHTQARGLADFNPRAGYYRVVTSNIGSPPYVQFFNSNTASTSAVLTDFKSNLLTPYWGRGTTTDNSNVIARALLFDVPRRETGSAVPPISSLASFQHANLAAEDIPPGGEYNLMFGSSTVAGLLPPNPGHQPAYAEGNSYASALVARDKAIESRTDLWENGSDRFTRERNYFDMSYLLNAALWDGNFLSTIPQTGDHTPANPRYRLLDGATPVAVRDGTGAAAHVVIEGGFNINSTSVDAWAALLGGMKQLPNIPGLGSSGTRAAAAFPRSLWQTTAPTTVATGTGGDSYSGYRELADSDVRALSGKIVEQVRLRGPFVSLGHFINRALVPAASTTVGGLGQAGALQKAIDEAGLNTFSDWTPAEDEARIPQNGTGVVDDSSAVSDMGGRGAGSSYADGINAAQPTSLRRSTAIPGWLTQADILQAVGSVLSARSDTFVVRTYGEVKNPSTGEVTARAWCEAVLQRFPEYVEAGADTATVLPSALTSTVNQRFGRRFKIVSFRWLGPEDI